MIALGYASGAARRSRTDWGARLHFGLLAFLPFALLMPPADGTMMVVPLMPAEVDQATVWASRAGARLVGRGPLPGSLVVSGSSRLLWQPALAHGAIIIDAGFAGCGGQGEGVA